MGACRLASGTEQTSALCDSWRTTEQQLLTTAYSFLPANGAAGGLLLFFFFVPSHFLPPHKIYMF